MARRGWSFTITTKDGRPAPGAGTISPPGSPSTTISTWSRGENRDRRRAAEDAGLDVTVRRAPRLRDRS